jgi:hypothetical protein
MGGSQEARSCRKVIVLEKNTTLLMPHDPSARQYEGTLALWRRAFGALCVCRVPEAAGHRPHTLRTSSLEPADIQVCFMMAILLLDRCPRKSSKIFKPDK